MCAANTSVKARGEKITSSYHKAQAPAAIAAASIPLARLAQAKPNHTVVSDVLVLGFGRFRRDEPGLARAWPRRHEAAVPAEKRKSGSRIENAISISCRAASPGLWLD